MYFKDSRLEDLLNECTLVVFDMNGLIVDDGSIMMVINETLQPYGIRFTESDLPVGLRDRELFIKAFEDSKVSYSQELITELITIKFEKYRAFIQSDISLLVFPGVIDIINYLYKSESHLLTLATSSSIDEVNLVLGKDGLDIQNKFEFIITGDNVKNAKPHPEIYNNVVQQVHVPAQKCLVFEDSSVGVESAVRAGMSCIAVPNSFTEKHQFKEAIYVIDNLTSEAKIQKNHA